MKGSDFWIDADIKYFNPSALFHSVNHSGDMDRDDYPGSPQVMEKYCQYPVPSYYELIYSVHQVGNRCKARIFYLLLYKPYYCNFPESKKNKF